MYVILIINLCSELHLLLNLQFDENELLDLLIVNLSSILHDLFQEHL
jgi:hypothetical protein